MDGRDREALPEGQEASRGPPRGLGGICRPIRRVVRSREWMAVRGWKDLPEVRKRSVGLPGGP